MSTLEPWIHQRRTYLTERDRTLMMDLYRTRVMMTKDIGAAYFHGGQQGCNRRLMQLEKRGYLQSEFLNQAKHGRTHMRGKVYFLTKEGVKLVQEELEWPVFDLDTDDYKDRYVPAKGIASKLAFVASAYAHQAKALERKGWEWLSIPMMKAQYTDDLRYPALGYLAHYEQNRLLPVFIAQTFRQRGKKGQMARILKNYLQILDKNHQILNQKILPAIILVEDEQYDLAVEVLQGHSRLPYRLIPISLARTHLAYAIEDENPPGLYRAEEDARFPWLIRNQEGVEHYVVNLAHFHPEDIWKAAGYTRQVAESEARYHRRPARPLLVIVAGALQQETLIHIAPDPAMFVFYTPDGRPLERRLK